MTSSPTLPKTSKSIRLLRRPKEGIDPNLSGSGTFGWHEESVTSASDLKEGEALVVVEWLSLDPAMRGWLNNTRSYVPPVGINEVMRAGGVGKIAALGPQSTSAKKQFKVGDWVNGVVGWQEVAKVETKTLDKILVGGKIEPSYYLGALGMPAQTAYWGLHDVAKIKKGETVVISGAAGAVGTVAVQLAKEVGCKVVAFAGGPEKCSYLRSELGVDAALDYKDPNFVKNFREVGYIDVYFDNVGGEQLDMVLTRLKKGARIALCGAISAYNSSSPRGLQQYLNLISQRAKLEGFIVFDYADRYHIAQAEFARLLEAGKFKVRETRLEGLEKCPDGLIGLFAGKNTGKLVVKVNGSGRSSKL